MSSLAYPHEAGSSRVLGRRLSCALARRGTDVLLGVALAVFAVVLLGEMVHDFNVDSWLALVTGRLVWQGGIPHHETLTVVSQGQPWVDEQWLSQLASYAIYLIGGLGLLGVVNVALLAVPVAVATFVARRLGASFRSVIVALPALLTIISPSREIRTQEFAIPLFVAVAYLLVHDSRRSSRRVYWCLPILVLWANLHGSVTLGAGLVALRGLTVAWERRGALLHGVGAWRRPLALVLGPVAAILVTPYGLSMVGYYHATMASGNLRQFVTEWRPVTATPVIAVALFLVGGVAIWSFGRHPEKTTTWEKLAFLILLAGSISVVRNTLFCGLLGLMIVPVSWAWGPAQGPQQSGERLRAAINGTLGALAILVVAAAVLVSLVRPASVIEYPAQQPRLLTAVQRATRADPSLRVLTDDHFADWLLWRDPALSGRIANDVRFELLSTDQLDSLENFFAVIGLDWKSAARGYRLIVLTRKDDAGAMTGLLREPGHRILYEDSQQIVILRSAAAAG